MSDFEKVSGDLGDGFVLFIPFYGYKQKCWQWKEWMTQHLVTKWQSRANSRTAAVLFFQEKEIQLVPFDKISVNITTVSCLFNTWFIYIMLLLRFPDCHVRCWCLGVVKWRQQQTCNFFSGWRDKGSAQSVAEGTINTILCVSVSASVERWGQASQLRLLFSQSLYPSRSLQALFVSSRDLMSQYLNSCRR